MSRALAHRIQRLEALYNDGSCPACGSDDAGPVDYEVTWDDGPTETEDEFCGHCGRQTTFVVMWHDTDTDFNPQPAGHNSRDRG